MGRGRADLQPNLEYGVLQDRLITFCTVDGRRFGGYSLRNMQIDSLLDGSRVMVLYLCSLRIDHW